MRRSLKNNPAMMGGPVMDGVSETFDPGIPPPKRHNTTYGPADFHRVMVAAALLGVSAFGYASAMRNATTFLSGLKKSHRRAVSGEWIRDTISRIKRDQLIKAFNEKIGVQLDRLQELGMLAGRKMDVAIDMHLIPRWDSNHNEDVVRSKSKGKTGSFERYVTAQCVNRRMNLALGVIHMPALEDASDFVRRIIKTCRDNRVRIGVAMLDREFFSTDVIRTLHETGVDFLMPCVNTTNVIRAIAQFDRGERMAVSRFRIAKTKNDYEEYTMIITKRKRKSRKSGGKKPEEEYIAFATSVPGIKPDLYSKRWVIETGYRMVESQRVRTRSTSSTARLFCFLYSMILYNVWVLANAELTRNPGMSGGSGVYLTMRQIDMKAILLLMTIPRDLARHKPPDPCCICHAAGCAAGRRIQGTLPPLK